MKRNRVVLADDHRPFRDALRDMLQRHLDIEVVGEAGDGIEALGLVRSVRPDVLVLDVRMPNSSGVDALRQLTAALPSVKVIVLSSAAERIFASEMLAAGARGYVTKGNTGELPRAIRAVMNDGTYLSTELAAMAAIPPTMES